MWDVAVIEDPVVAEITLDPMRTRLLAELVEPASATMLAARVGLARQKVNYHLRELERHGLIELLEERRKGNVTERLMRATALSYVISPSVLAAVTPDPAQSPDRLSAGWLLALSTRLVREVGAHIVGARNAGKATATFGLDAEVRFANPADRAALAADLTNTVAALISRYHDATASGGRITEFWLLSTWVRRRTRSRARSPDMPHEFEIADEIDLDAAPEEVWDATGPGVDSWFMGHTEIEPAQGGTHRLDMSDALGFVLTSTVTAWEPGKRLTFREDSPDGTFTAFEYELKGRDGGRTTLRFAHNGILSGDDWEAQYDGMKAGDRMYLELLATYLKHFPGRFSTRNPFLVGPAVSDNERVWSRFTDALSLPQEITQGSPARLHVPGLPATDGVVEFVGEPHFVGVRTSQGIYQLIKGYRDTLVVGYHGFSDDADDQDDDQIESAWRSWLASTSA